MAIVLVEGILERVFFPVKALSPFWRSFITENPPIHILCFNHEDAENRDNYMIDLSGAARRRNDEIVNAGIDRRVKAKPHSKLSATLPKPAFENREHEDDTNIKFIKSPVLRHLNALFGVS